MGNSFSLSKSGGKKRGLSRTPSHRIAADPHRRGFLLNLITTSHLKKKEERNLSDTLKKYTVNTTNPRSFEPDFIREDPTTKKYSCKVIRSGSTVEVYEYEKPRTEFVSGVKKSGPRKERKRVDNIYRARNVCKHLINCNRDRGQYADKFVTLTFADSRWSDLKEANYEVHKFMMRLEYQLHIKVRYVAVPEIQMDRWEKYGTKVWHFHVYFFGLPYIPNSQLRKIWGNGFVRINRIDQNSDVGSYVTKYMQESFSAFNEKGMKRFFRSGGLREPEELRAESTAQILERMEIPENLKPEYGPVRYENEKNPFIGPVTYTRYVLNKTKEGTRNDKEISDNQETSGNDHSSGCNTMRGVS